MIWSAEALLRLKQSAASGEGLNARQREFLREEATAYF
jgi:hypothetical protein